MRIIQVISTEERNGTILRLSQTDAELCLYGESLNLSALPNLSGGDWSTNAPVGSLSNNVFDPLTAGAGVWMATYSVEINGCLVQADIELTVYDAPALPVTIGDTYVCDGGSASLRIENPVNGESYN